MSRKKTAEEREATAKRIAALIERADLTQSEVAAMMGVERNDIYRWSRGKAEPSPARYMDLYEVLRSHIRNLTLETVMGLPEHRAARVADRLDSAEARASKEAP